MIKTSLSNFNIANHGVQVHHFGAVALMAALWIASSIPSKPVTYYLPKQFHEREGAGPVPSMWRNLLDDKRMADKPVAIL